MALPISVVHQIPGDRSVELTQQAEGVKLSSAAVGGFGSAEFAMQGDQRRRLGYLGMVRFYYGSALLWEGQLEDRGITFDASSRTTQVRAFGLRRKLDETSVRRIWSKRDLQPIEIAGGIGAWVPFIAGGGEVTKADVSLQTGRFDPTDTTKTGVRVTGNGVSVAYIAGSFARVQIPGAAIVRVMGTVAKAGAGVFTPRVVAWTDGASTLDYNDPATGALNWTPGANRDTVAFGAWNATGGAVVYTATDLASFTDIRLLGTTITEDASGGFYGGTILRDLVALCPELTIGIIEGGSDFTIQAIERSVRDTAASVVDEVTGYYTREWAVWEDGKFDWKTRNLDEPQWIAKLTDLDSFEIDASTDDIARTVYVLYTDAASGLDAEASAVTTDQRNPYLRQSKTKDLLVTAGFPMTANTSAQLATVVARDAGARPSVGGTCTLAADKLIANAVGTSKPAALIRGGENIVFPELPKTDVLLQGRDGETLFHVASVELDVDANKITLTLEGQQRRTDVILARLAAATRTLTG